MKTSKSLLEIIEDGASLLPYSSSYSYHIKNAILFEASDDCEDGIYLRPSDYIRLVNKIESEGPSAWINRLTRKKNKLEIEYLGCTIVREKDWQDDAVLEFKEPINVVLAHIGEEPVVKQVKKIRGEFTHDWFWLNGGRQDKVANGFEIYFNIKEYLE